jgi:hypothetical protein
MFYQALCTLTLEDFLWGLPSLWAARQEQKENPKNVKKYASDL